MKNVQDMGPTALVYNAITQKEAAAYCASDIYFLTEFAFGKDSRLSAEYESPSDCVRRDILVGDAKVGTVTWL